MAGIRTQNRLKAIAVEKQRTPGIYADGGGLSLIVTDAGVKRWELSIAASGHRRQLGLGIYPMVSLESARRKASDIRDAVRQGTMASTGRRLTARPVQQPAPK